MIKIISLILTTTLLLANTLVVSSKNSMVKTNKITLTKRVYLGSFLAIGHLPSTEIYSIDAPLEGVVEKLNVNIYEKVKKGSILAIIKSPKILELESIYINLLIEEEYNENELKRLEPLYKAAIVAKKQYLKAENTLAKYKTQTEFYYHLLQEWGLSKSQVNIIKRTKKPIPRINIYSPISGNISDLNIFPKMYMQRAKHMMTILNKEKTHVEIALPLSIAKKLKPGFKLYTDDSYIEIESIASKLDARTQTLSVHFAPSESMKIMPNEKKNIKLYWPRDAFVVNSSSIVEYNNKPALFVKEKDTYRLEYISIIGRSSDKVYIICENIQEGNEIAISGVISLKGALEGQNND